MRARKQAEPDRIDILIDRDPRDIFRRFAQARINHLGAGVAQCQHDHFRTRVVPVEARLRD